MINFTPLRTRRLDVRLRELTIREAVQLAAMPVNKHEAATSALLRCIVEQADGAHADPGRWTVQERMLVVAHYIACATDGQRNFPVGDLRFLDFLMPELDAGPDTAPAGEACGDTWAARQITGDEAEAMEAVCTTRLEWMAADMAARLYVADKPEQRPRPDPHEQRGEYAAWLRERRDVILAMPEGDFEELFVAYSTGTQALMHLFELNFEDEGFVAIGRKEGGPAQPARFPVDSALGRIAKLMGGRAD